MFLELDFKGVYQSSEKKKKESCCLVFPSSTKPENRMFHVVVVQRRLRNVQRTRAKLLFCQSNPIAFLPFSLLWMTAVHCFPFFFSP